MPREAVDQLLPDGTVTQAPDPRLSDGEKVQILLEALPGAEPTEIAGVRAIRHEGHLLLYKQVTHLGRPWPGFKKRIQIPMSWLAAERAARESGLTVHFLGIYRFGEVTIFVDFDPTTYVRRKANNSAAHVSTNDLYQALTLGIFAREDRRGNVLSSVRADHLRAHLAGEEAVGEPAIEVFRLFNAEMLSHGRLGWEDAVVPMAAAGWKDAFQGEWPGFYLEFRFDRFVRAHDLDRWAAFQKVKRRGAFDYDLVLHEEDGSAFFGDLKASNALNAEAPGNDDEDLRRCVADYGRFWYVVYEHETWKASANGDLATIAWNEWKWSAGHRPSRQGEMKPLSYRTRFKEAVDFNAMFVLEVNPSNIDVVLGEFRQGHQPSGADRALKVMIKKRNIENFLVYSHRR